MNQLVKEFWARVKPVPCPCQGRGFWIFYHGGGRGQIERCDDCKRLLDDATAARLVEAIIEQYIATGDKAP